MKQFLKTWAVCLALLGLFLVLCMGWPAGMVLLVVFERAPLLFGARAALLPAAAALAWTAAKGRRSAPPGEPERDLEGWKIHQSNVKRKEKEP